MILSKLKLNYRIKAKKLIKLIKTTEYLLISLFLTFYIESRSFKRLLILCNSSKAW